jgi:hypothetical protein
MTDPTAAPQAEPSPPTLSAEDVIGQAQRAYTQAAPDIRRLAHYFHRRLRGELHKEAVAETEAFVWVAFLKLIEEGRDPLSTIPTIVDFEGRRVRELRRFAGKVHAQDALSQESRQRDGYLVTSLSRPEKEVAPEVRSAMRHRSPGPAEVAIANADWEAFLKSLPDDRYRDLARGLVDGYTLKEIAARRGVSAESVRQLTDRLQQKYVAFHAGGKDR